MSDKPSLSRSVFAWLRETLLLRPVSGKKPKSQTLETHDKSLLHDVGLSTDRPGSDSGARKQAVFRNGSGWPLP